MDRRLFLRTSAIALAGLGSAVVGKGAMAATDYEVLTRLPGVRPKKKSLSGIPGMFQSLGAKGSFYDMTDINSLFQDAAGTVPVAAVGDPVGLVKDKSGNGLNMTQATGSSRPTYAAPSGGKARLSFDGNSQYMQVTLPSSFGGNGDKTISFALILNNLNYLSIGYMGSLTTKSCFGLYAWPGSSDFRVNQYGDDLDTSFSASAATPYVMTIWKQGDAVGFYINGSLVNSKVLYSTDVTNPVFRLGYHPSSRFFNGYMSSVVFMDQALSDADVSKLAGYQAAIR